MLKKSDLSPYIIITFSHTHGRTYTHTYTQTHTGWEREIHILLEGQIRVAVD